MRILGFTPLKGAIRYGLAAIKGLGNSAVNAIIAARKGGAFKSFFDFAEQVEPGALNRRNLESLVGAGAFDSLNRKGRDLHEWRAALHNAIDAAIARAQRARRERLQGQNGLFGTTMEDLDQAEQIQVVDKPWTHSELLAAEKAALGFYITGHPLGEFGDLLQILKAVKSVELPTLTSGGRVGLGGIISDLQPRTTKKGDKFALLRLEDEFGGTKCVLWPEVYRKYSNHLRNELPVFISGRLELGEDNAPTVIVDQVQHLDDILRNGELVVLRLPSSDDPEGLFDMVLHVVNSHPGNCDVALECLIDTGTLVRVKVNSALRVDRSGSLESACKQLGCTLR